MQSTSCHIGQEGYIYYVLINENNTNIIALSIAAEGIFNHRNFGIYIHNNNIHLIRCTILDNEEVLAL